MEKTKTYEFTKRKFQWGILVIILLFSVPIIGTLMGISFLIFALLEGNTESALLWDTETIELKEVKKK